MQASAQEGRKILLWVMLVIFLLLIWDFHSIKYAILAMIPVGLTLVIMIGTMAIFGIEFEDHKLC